MYRSILVPLDGSEFGEQALPLALGLAQQSGAAVQLVHIHSPLAAVYLEGAGFLDDSLDEHVKQQQQNYLERTRQRLSRASSVSVTVQLLEGPIAPTLAKFAAEQGVDLVVMTTHGRGMLGRFWLGSVTDELLHLIPVPILLIPPQAEKPRPEGAVHLRHILLALDGTEFAEKMIATTTELATLTGAEVTLVRTVKPVMPTVYPIEGFSVEQAARTIVDRLEKMQQLVCKEAEEYLQQAARSFKERGVTHHTDVAVESQPAVGILKEAERRKCDVIAIETHARHGLSRLVLGSVADKVIRGSMIPILLHHPATG